MLDDILKRIGELKLQKGRINEEIVKLSDQASAEMKKVLHGERKPRKGKSSV